MVAPITLPNKSIQLDIGAFSVTGLSFNGPGALTILGSGVAPLVGTSTANNFNVNGGEVRLQAGRPRGRQDLCLGRRPRDGLRRSRGRRLGDSYDLTGTAGFRLRF